MITPEQIMREIVALAVKSPEKVYEKNQTDTCPLCLYTVDKYGCVPGENGCLFGRALYKLFGQRLLDKVYKEGEETCSYGITHILEYLEVDVTSDELSLFINMQDLQDSGMAWGTCILEQKSEIEKIFPSVDLSELETKIIDV